MLDAAKALRQRAAGMQTQRAGIRGRHSRIALRFMRATHLGYAFGLRAERRFRRWYDSIMASAFKEGDHVTWNSEAGHVSGRIIKIHRADFHWKGYQHRASADEPQYEIKSDKTDHVAVHKGSALHHKNA